MTLPPQPGDILAVRSTGLAGRLIRFGAAIRDEPNLVNHIAIVHHADAHGTLWCLEGRPGGVGWRDARDYLASRWTVTNIAQPKTGTQRQAVTSGAEALIGTSYDWEAIAADTAQALGVDWAPTWHGNVPGHVVCSSLAAYLYGRAGLARPAGSREVTPADWLTFIITNDYGGPA